MENRTILFICSLGLWAVSFSYSTLWDWCSSDMWPHLHKVETQFQYYKYLFAFGKQSMVTSLVTIYKANYVTSLASDSQSFCFRFQRRMHQLKSVASESHAHFFSIGVQMIVLRYILIAESVLGAPEMSLQFRVYSTPTTADLRATQSQTRVLNRNKGSTCIKGFCSCVLADYQEKEERVKVVLCGTCCFLLDGISYDDGPLADYSR